MSQVMASTGSLKRAMKLYFKFFPKLAPLVGVCILVNALAAAAPALFQRNILKIIEDTFASGDWEAARPLILQNIIPLVSLYAVALILSVVQTQVLAYMTQRYLSNLREEMFAKMQTLPLSYFDSHKHGDIMSHYTNDIDTLRQFVSMAFPTLLRAGLLVTAVFCIMLSYSIWLTLILCLGIVLMVFITGRVGAGSAKYFVRQQKAVASTEGFIQEIMNGQKVVKVFNH